TRATTAAAPAGKPHKLSTQSTFFMSTILLGLGTKRVVDRLCGRRLVAFPHTCGRASGENAAAATLLVAAPFQHFRCGGPLPALAPRGRRGEVQQSGGASPSSDSLACLCRAGILRAVRDQSRHCGVSAAETDPDRCGAAKGPRGKQR